MTMVEIRATARLRAKQRSMIKRYGPDCFSMAPLSWRLFRRTHPKAFLARGHEIATHARNGQ